MSQFFAHSLPGRPPSDWEPLEVHLRNVAERAGEFAAAFGAKDWGYLAGLWHDLGKYLPDFQRKLNGERVQIEHAGAGAARVAQLSNDMLWLPLASAIAGHHAGLANHTSSKNSALSPLMRRLEDNRVRLARIQPWVPQTMWEHSMPAVPAFLQVSKNNPKDSARTVAFFTRMLFSALVDADSLETERFYGSHLLREKPTYDKLQFLRDVLETQLDQLAASAIPSRVNAIRSQVLKECREAALQKPGCFSLTVPTGGGKTLSAMSFALNHAVTHGHRRVIVVVPYTAIIEQNAVVYKRFLSPKNVVEHHSNLDDFADLEENDEQALRRRLACENWDAPVIVTTNVQFLESLFAHKKSRCRKLHNIARSVVVLDEAQTVPVGFLRPVLDALHALTADYGCTVVLCTATQPALQRREALPNGLQPIVEIVRNPLQLGQDLRRVEVHWPDDPAMPTSYDELAGQIAAHPAVLAIVHRRRDAASLARLVSTRCPGETLLHLSALMCPAHRRKTVKAIQRKLMKHRHDGVPCRVIATQLVEAGADLDFPVVYRALAGMDSIAQAAGRCNREGRLDLGHVYVFRADTDPPGDTLMRALGVTCKLLELGRRDLNDPRLFTEYFSRFYASEEQDVSNIRGELAELNFENAGRKFRLIEDGHLQSIVIPWDKVARQRIRRLRKVKPLDSVPRGLLRSLQPYTVQAPPHQFSTLKGSGALEGFFEETLWILNWRLFPDAYDRQFGLTVEAEIDLDPAALIVSD